MKIGFVEAGSVLQVSVDLGYPAVVQKLEEVNGVFVIWFQNGRKTVQEAVQSYATSAKPVHPAKAYWARLSPAERQAEMARRVAKRNETQAAHGGRKRAKKAK